ncbi:histidine kinase [Prolixibacteraceae bacterium Z1-6]|uniref:Histidine kinase n=1 Tax=Draconibacterium aestuarii TaxID=2998507 RepID=A0A9X3F4R2_9BACT|nr:histidine kinase [Prolixibacteraceae bacterium Z1-6]
MKTNPKNIFSNPYFQSAFVGALVTLLVFFVWDAPIKKYEIEIEPFDHKASHPVHWFAGDFNGDGSTEKIRCHNGVDSKSLDVVHYDANGNITEHYHFPKSEWRYQLNPATFDIDCDGTLELLFFTVRNDSIFFNACNLVSFEIIIDHHYFHSFEQKQKQYAHNSEFCAFGDTDGNGTSELFFTFDAGFGLYPRGLFKMEFPSLKITASDTEYMNLSFGQFKDFNKDGVPEIIAQSYAPSNATEYDHFTDTMSYLALFRYDLQFLFSPIPNPHRFSSVQAISSPKHDSIFYALFFSRSVSKIPFQLMVFNTKGKIVNQRSWSNITSPETMYPSLKHVNGTPRLFIKGIGDFALTPDLKGLPDYLDKGTSNSGIPPLLYDFNKDGWDEWFLWNRKDEISIYNEKNDELLTFESPLPRNSSIHIYPVLNHYRLVNHLIDTGYGYFLLSYKKNPYYFTLYLIYALTFATSSLLIFFLLYFQRKRIEERLNTEKQLAELQFNAVKNQLNPHFLFNALNSVAYMINEGKKQQAYDFLSINSRMIQRVMRDSKEVKRPLTDEIQFTKDYLSIQQHRFKDRFCNEFEIDPQVDLRLEVPKMCIHTYVENAIKHGFRNTKSGGLLKVYITPLVNGISVSISDNGMGRKAASEFKDFSGNGINIMNEFYRLFEKYHGYKIYFHISDLKESTGTKVELRVQIDRKV